MFALIVTNSAEYTVDFLGLQPSVGRSPIGIIGICGFGGMGLNAAAVDERIRAVVTTSMSDMSRVMSKGYFDSQTKDQRSELLERMSQQRWADAQAGRPAPNKRILPKPLDGVTNPVVRRYFEYYRTARGFHERSPNANGAWTTTGAFSFMNLPLMTYIAEISPRPILLIAGENAHSRYFTEDAYSAAAEPKELLIVYSADHVERYDHVDKIPFDTIAAFFAKNLK